MVCLLCGPSQSVQGAISACAVPACAVPYAAQSPKLASRPPVIADQLLIFGVLMGKCMVPRYDTPPSPSYAIRGPNVLARRNQTGKHLLSLLRRGPAFSQLRSSCNLRAASSNPRSRPTSEPFSTPVKKMARAPAARRERPPGAWAGAPQGSRPTGPAGAWASAEGPWPGRPRCRLWRARPRGRPASPRRGSSGG